MNKVCQLCGQDFSNVRKLSKHLRDRHSNIKKDGEIISKTYYDLFCRKENEGNCIICNSATTWETIEKGYKVTCSHVCAGIYTRANLKSNEEKYTRFVATVKENQKRIWAERDTYTRKEITNKVSATVKSQNSLLTENELKEKYGWMNKLSEKEKADRVEDILNKSLRKFWKNASTSKKEDVIRRRAETLRKTWELHGDEIYNKIQNTFAKNAKECDFDDDEINEGFAQRLNEILGVDITHNTSSSLENTIDEIIKQIKQ